MVDSIKNVLGFNNAKDGGVVSKVFSPPRVTTKAKATQMNADTNRNVYQ